MDEGKVLHLGVSNFSLSRMKEAEDALSKHVLASNQVEYNLLRRGLERALLPYCEGMNIAILAYRPITHGTLAKAGGTTGRVMEEISRKHDGKIAAQVALNWLLN